jgi:MoxR-like ATPase
MAVVARPEEEEPAGPGEAPLQAAITLGRDLVEHLGRVLLGAPDAVRSAATAALCGGHLLIEDVPGVGKTVLARALAGSLGVALARVQGNPDLLPSDVTGVSVFSTEDSRWEFRPGPVFSNVVLVDELNRTPPRTQSALLETMEEQQVTVDGETWPLPRPHLVVATQNPHTHLGTYPLVDSQLDRFALCTTIGYPDADTEARLVRQDGGKFALDHLTAVADLRAWARAQRATGTVQVSEAVARYGVDLARATRHAASVRLGASPRASIWLVRAAQAHAVLSGRGYVVPGDVKAVAVGVLAHRLGTEHGTGQSQAIVRDLLDSVPAPRP